MRRLRTRLTLALTLMLTVVAASPSPPAQASSVTVLGAGSTWDAIATAQWEADVHVLYGITINYEPVGSSAGRNFYIQNQVDFGDSDIPFQRIPGDDELSQLQGEHKTFQYLPTVAGATGVMYNLHTPSGNKITNLQLDSRALVGIFIGTITQWTDPAITSINPQLRGQLPNARIVPVVRADGSGTSAMFSDYLRQLQPAAWSRFCASYQISPCGQTSFWPLTIPGVIGQKGSDGVANYVVQQYNSITYVETGYALQRNMPVALVKNQSGHFVFPSSVNDAVALQHARIQPDLISDLSGVHVAPEANAYPISGYSYMITPTAVGFGFTPQKGAVLGKFILYNACAGQKKAASLGYAPLTPVLVKGVFAAVRRIPGAPTPPPLSQCANPTITGQPGNTGPSGNQGGSGTTGNGNPGGPSPTGNQGGGGKSPGVKKTGGKTPGTGYGSGSNGAGVLPTSGIVLTAAELSARQAAALSAINRLQPASSSPLGWAALDVLVVALFPFLIWRGWRLFAPAPVTDDPDRIA
jgi:phosphate transport system substrate-binding protein